MKPIVGLCSLCLLLAAGPVNGAACENWNTAEFFKTATPQAVTDCIQAGTDPNAQEDVSFGGTPLLWAALHNEDPAVLTVLLSAGADSYARTKRDYTPLHLAAWGNPNPAVITTLLNAGADPNAPTKCGRTPLHEAAVFNKNPAVVTALLDAGADPAVRDEQGRTPRDYVEHNEALKDTDAYRRLNDGS